MYVDNTNNDFSVNLSLGHETFDNKCNFIMMQEKRTETVDFKRHFNKLHERIQHKYEDMQKKLAKSRSVDAITGLKEDDDFREQKERHCSNSELSANEIDNEKHNKLTQSVIVEEVVTRNASYQDLTRESSTLESVDDFMMVEKEDLVNEDKFFGGDFSRFSLESLNETGVESDGSANTIPSTPKLSIRNRISIKLSAAKEKRRENKREKENVTKEKKKDAREKVEKFILSNTTKQDVLKICKRTKVATVTIALIEASDLETDITEEKPRFMFCRFKLGGEKYKSKLIKCHATVVKWQELFNLSMYDEHMLEISLWDKDCFIGRSLLDLSEINMETTHKMRIKLECDIGKAELFILLTISGTSHMNTLVDLDDYQETHRQLVSLKKKYAWYHVQNNTGDIGWLSVIVYGAKGLSGNECYCILQLDNDRLQTQTESKTSDPNWMKIFTFKVHDITSILVLTVHDEKKSEDIGKVSIPLLDIKNVDKKWFALKDVTQRERAKGNNPRILIEMKLTWNLLRASIRVINPKEENYLEVEDKLQRHMFARNLARAKAVVNWIIGALKIVKTLFEWESRKLNLIALVIWLLFCWTFRVWMLPLLLLIPFIWYRPQKYVFFNWKKYFHKELDIAVYDDSKKEEKEEKTSLRQKFHSLTDMLQSVQNFIGVFARYGESIKNLFNFTVPFLSFFAIFMISVIALVMYLIPVKYIFMIWGIHKFLRKTLRPNRVPNNEIMDLLSRVPDDETLLNVKQLPVEEGPEEDVLL